jgi:hypothetical protein
MYQTTRRHIQRAVVSSMRSSDTIFIRLVLLMFKCLTASMVKWSEFLPTDSKVPGSIPGATRFSEK